MRQRCYGNGVFGTIALCIVNEGVLGVYRILYLHDLKKSLQYFFNIVKILSHG